MSGLIDLTNGVLDVMSKDYPLTTSKDNDKLLQFYCQTRAETERGSVEICPFNDEYDEE